MIRRLLNGVRDRMLSAPWRAVLLMAVFAGMAVAASRHGLLEAAEMTTLVAGEPAITRIASTTNGQVVRGLVAGGGIVAIEPSAAAVPREVVAPAGRGECRAIGCLPGDVTAVVVNAGDAWFLRTYRVKPSGAVSADAPLQEIPLGQSTGSGDDVGIAVSRARGWLAIVGLPAPLPPVVRAAVAGVRIGPVSDRGCPKLGDGLRPVAATVGPFDELVLAVQREGEPPDIAYFDASGRELLRLPAALEGITGLEMGSEDGLLWATGGDADGGEGLWRLDAGLQQGRQVIRPTLVAPLAVPVALACCSPRAIIVVHGATPTMTLVNPLTTGASE